MVERALQTIERNARLQTRLSTICSTCRGSSAGRLRLDAGPVELVPLLESVIDATRPDADEKGIQPPRSSTPWTEAVHGDQGRLHQVFWNLLSNAIKFTPAGGRVEVGLSGAGDEVRGERRPTPGRASARTSFPTSSIASGKRTRAPPAPTAAWASGSRSCATS